MNSLNRDPKRVIFIDWNKDSVGLAMNNALILPKWEGDNADTSLIGLSHLLQGTVNGFRLQSISNPFVMLTSMFS